MQTSFRLLCSILILTGCIQNQPKIDYSTENPNDSIALDSIVSDTSRILVAELPVYFDSTDYLIHAVGFVSLDDRSVKGILKSGSFSSSDYESGFAMEGHSGDYFSGNIANLVFENLHTRNMHKLTDKYMSIPNVQYLRELAWNTGRHYLLYCLIDRDLDHNGTLGYGDISSLYISKVDGTGFRKLTDSFQDYAGGELIVRDLKYYFRTIEDKNRDGKFNIADGFRYFYIDFALVDYKVVEYFPLKMITK
jgi:hypothetical protein